MNKVTWALILATLLIVGYFRLIIWAINKMSENVKELIGEYKDIKKEESLFEKEYDRFMHNKEI